MSWVMLVRVARLSAEGCLNLTGPDSPGVRGCKDSLVWKAAITESEATRPWAEAAK